MMMKMFAGYVVVLSLVWSSVGQAWEGSWAKELVPDAVGTRVTYYWLRDTSRAEGHTYLGSIDGQNAEQDLLPYKAFVQWDLGRFIFLEATWDRVEAVEESEHGRDDSDGKLSMFGPVFTVNARLPNETRYTPFAGLGVAPWRANFEHADWHHYGFGSIADWQSVGSPTSPRNGKSRHIDVEDGLGFVATLGLHIEMAKNWVVDLYGRYMDIDAEYEFTIEAGGDTLDRRTGTFPLDNFVAGVGVSRHF